MPALVRKRFKGYSCNLWHNFFATANELRTVDYVPEDIFYNVFLDRLNSRLSRLPYGDKNYFDRLNWSCLPVTTVRVISVINERLCDKFYRQIDLDTAVTLARESGLPELVVKPSRESGDGKRLMFMEVAELPKFLAAVEQPVEQDAIRSAMARSWRLTSMPSCRGINGSQYRV